MNLNAARTLEMLLYAVQCFERLTESLDPVD